MATALALCGEAAAAGCGPTYGADGIGLDRGGAVWFTHFEDTRIARLEPDVGRFREHLADTRSSPIVTTQVGRIKNGTFDYLADSGFSAMVLDEERGYVWATRFNSDRLARFSLKNERFQEFRFGTPLVHSRGTLPLSPDGSLWLLSASPDPHGLGKGKLVRFAPGGRIAAELPLPAKTFASPAVAVDVRGRPWIAFTPLASRKPVLFTLSRGRLKRQSLPDVGTYITGMAFDGRDSLWLTAPERNAVVRYGQGKATFYAVPTPESFPHQIFAAPDGQVWFTEWNGHRIGRIDASGTIREYPLPPEEESPLTLAFAPDGAVWFSTLFSYALFRLDPQTGAIKEFSVPPPSNWFQDSAKASMACAVSSRQALETESAPLPPARHPAGASGDPDAALFEKSCNTRCHSWYRVERAAQRRTDWSATVDRMIRLNGASFIGTAERERILRYLNRQYAANPQEAAR